MLEEFRVWGLGFRVYGLGLRVYGLGCRIWGVDQCERAVGGLLCGCARVRCAPSLRALAWPEESSRVNNAS